jgi:alkanesulfonate monooxygenase SsuD/methylene tetrahydromethanopterin reductase-like flavin-dependent oxidoreductase (luciferase family)
VRFGLSGLSAQSLDDSREAYGRELRRIPALAEAAEASGFDSVWVTEHHVSDDGYLPAPLVALGAIATRTERVLLGTNVALAPLYQPVRLAEECAVVDQVAGGRLVLGLGLGYRPEEFAALEVEPSDRVPRLARAVEVCRAAWRGDPVGPPDGARRSPVRPLPSQDPGPPIWVGAWVEAGVRRARHLGDGYIAPVGTVKDLRRRLAWLDEEAPLDGYPVAVSVNAFVAASGAWEKAERGVGHVLEQYGRWYSGSDDPEDTGKGRLVTSRAGGPPPHFVAGTPEDCVEQLAPLCALLASLPGGGDGHLLVRLTYPGLGEADARTSVELFGRDVIPALRGAA